MRTEVFLCREAFIYMAPEARAKYASQVLKFITIDTLKPLKFVVNCGNGAAGPTFDAIAEELKLGGTLEI